MRATIYTLSFSVFVFQGLVVLAVAFKVKGRKVSICNVLMLNMKQFELNGSCRQLTRAEDCWFFSFCNFEYACELLSFCVGAGQDFLFNVWISQFGHKLVLERTVEMVSELAVDGSAFQSVTEINEPLALCRYA